MKAVVLGVGRMGRQHVRALRELGLDVVGVADPSAESRAAACEQLALEASLVFDDPERLVRDARPECVVVASTAPAHARLVCAAAEHGARYVLCEKPMAASLDECDEMIATCESRGVALAINHSGRFLPAYIETKRVIEQPAFGSWSSINVTAGNLGIAMNGTHYFELLRWLSGSAPSAVSAWFANEPVPNPRGVEFEDRAGSVRIVTENGKRMYLDFGVEQGHGCWMNVAGRCGILAVDEMDGTMIECVRNPEHVGAPTTRYGMPGTKRQFKASAPDSLRGARMMLAEMLGGGDYPSGHHGRLALATLVAAHLSSEAGGVAIEVQEAVRTAHSRKFRHA